MADNVIIKPPVKEMSFIDHLTELRKYFIILIITFVAGTIAGLVLFDKFIPILTAKFNQSLFVHSPTEAIIMQFNLAMAFGVFISIPVLVTCAVLYILPALGPKDKVVLFFGTAVAVALFVGGLLYTYYFMLPLGIKILLNPMFFPSQTKVMLNYTQAIKFTLSVLLALSFTFEFPVFLYILLYLKVITLGMLAKYFRFVVVIIFIIAAVISPPDPVSMCMLALPMIALFLLTMLAAKLTGVGKKKEAQ